MENTARAIKADGSLPRSLGGYILVEHFARGGMADVYLARSQDGRLVVVKQVIDELADSRHDALLLAESMLCTSLRHPNITRAIDLGRDHDGSPYAVFEYVEGIDLRDLLRLCSRRKIALPVASSLHVIRELLRGLDHAHRARDEDGDRFDVVHRDVTPSNVLISFDGDVKLCDFGIASATIMPPVPNDRIEGKTGYMSPEQARGRKLDKRSDIYAVGIMLWELLTGRRMRPKKGEPALSSARRGEVPPMALTGLPHEADLLAIVQRALQQKRKKRYESAGGMLRDLDAYCAKVGIDISPVDLATWLDATISTERDIAEARRMRAHATAIELRDSIYGSDPPAHSGVRKVVRPRKKRQRYTFTRQERLAVGTRAAVVAGALTALLYYFSVFAL